MTSWISSACPSSAARADPGLTPVLTPDVLAKEPPDRREPPRAIVDLDDDLPDERPVLGGDAAQHLQLLAFDIDFEQINSRKSVLLDDVRDRSQLAVKALCSALQQAGHPATQRCG